MKRILLLSLCALFITLFSVSANAQINVASTEGYLVKINVQPLAIVPTSNSCVNGYNYNVKLKYTVTFTGNNIPSHLYTLQGTIGCGTNTHFFSMPTTGGTGIATSGSNVWNANRDCATATISSLGCNLITIEIQGPGISQRFVSAPLNIVLPVSLVSFTAAQEQNAVKLKWATATESNNDYFSIERSANGNEWTSIKTIKGAGNSSSLINYEAVDVNPLQGISYYRLRQTDIDGKSTYSDVRTVESASTTSARISLYPIPNTGNTINLAGINNFNEHELSVLSTTGAVLYRTKLSRNSVELPSLKAGLYIVVVKNNASGQSTSFRYVKI